ncbi:MAG: LPS export ABC transporter permease LptG [Candidatus Binatia bacterium]
MTILWRYIALAWLRVFVSAVAATAGLYVVIDIFDRLGEVLSFGPSWTALVSYFLFKTPKILFDVYPAASLLATLVSMATLARTHELSAMRSCGMSDRRLASPVLACALLLSFGALFWSENVVPVSATRSRWLWDVELKQKVYRGVFDAASLWFQNDRGFVHIRRYDAGARVISGLSLYESDADFHLARVIEVESMTWRGDRWVSSAGFVKDVSGEDFRVRPLEPAELELHEDPENLAARKRRPEEFSFRQLRSQIAQLESRGLSADEYLVDLHHKLAWPFAGFFVALVGVPLALRAGSASGLARGTATGLVIGFAYWIVTGLALSAGRTGGVSPVAAAWAANGMCAMLAVLLFVRRVPTLRSRSRPARKA